MTDNEQNNPQKNLIDTNEDYSLAQEEEKISPSEESKEKLLEEPPQISPDRIDLNAMWVVRRLRAKGHEAYLTGGCVRDLLLNKTPKDFDVATSARPEEVKAIFRNCRLIGRRFLLAHVIFPGNKIVETATFRANPSEESSEEDSEDLLVMQDNVYGTMKEDAFRRDLTINGLFYDPVAGKVIDYVGGCADLEAGVIRTIGEPHVRMQEDPVRILRAIRFAERLGFSVEENTLSAMKEFAKDILRCAPARLQEEIIRLLTSGHAAGCMQRCMEIGLLDYLLPELLEGMGQIESAEDESDKKPADEESWQFWRNILEALDQIQQKKCYVASSVAFSALLLPAYMRLEKSATNERNWIDKLCVSWSERIRLTRRDQDLIRILLTAVPLFHLEKIHQKSAQYLVRKSWFKEALLIYILYLQARNESLEEVKIWKVLAQDAEAPYRQDKIGARPPQNRFRKRRVFQKRGFKRPYGRGNN